MCLTGPAAAAAAKHSAAAAKKAVVTDEVSVVARKQYHRVQISVYLSIFLRRFYDLPRYYKVHFLRQNRNVRVTLMKHGSDLFLT